MDPSIPDTAQDEPVGNASENHSSSSKPADLTNTFGNAESAQIPRNHHCHGHDHSDGFTEAEQEEERKHFHTVYSAFRQYKSYSLKKIARQNAHFNSLPDHQRNLLPDFGADMASLRQLVSINERFIDGLLNHLPFGHDMIEDNPESLARVGSFQMDKVMTTLRMLMRDWSKEGLEERNQAYMPLIEAVEKHLPVVEGQETRILTPGAGLGRLSWELAKRGYASIGNEFSLYMLFASNYILNHCNEVEMYKVYPWANTSSNNFSFADQISGVSVPDVNPSDLPPSHKFGMVAGDFLEVFPPDESWHAVVTCFFIDTAKNIFDYVDHIWNILQPGGFWVNLGPLLYHFADMPNECCIELTYDQLRTVIKNVGFQVLVEKLNIPCHYVQNRNSMLRYEYRCAFFVCQKPVESSQPAEEDHAPEEDIRNDTTSNLLV